jgi:predicted nucleotidyltransferase
MSSSPQLSGCFCGLAIQMLESLGLSSAQVDVLNATAFELSKIPGVIAVVLGGSYARRAARPDSELDVGLYYSKNSPPDIEAIRRCAETISVPNSPPTVVDYYK